MKENKDYVVLPYATREAIQKGLGITDEELDIALKQLEKMHLISIDNEGRIFDVIESFNRAAEQWQNS